jgi:hypothetical protein
MTEAKQVIKGVRREYNESRPIGSLGERTQIELVPVQTGKRCLKYYLYQPH